MNEIIKMTKIRGGVVFGGGGGGGGGLMTMFVDMAPDMRTSQTNKQKTAGSVSP